MTAASLRDAARWAVVAGTFGIAGAYASAFGSARVARAGEGLMAVALPVLLLGVMGLGALSRRSAPRAHRVTLAIAFVGLAVWIALGFVLALGASTPRPDVGRVLGLPWPAAVVLYGVGVVPLVVLPALFAWSHARTTTRSAERATDDGDAPRPFVKDGTR
ncbi:MAG TPA: hypothetical protein PKE51_10195 [Gemmatimonadaceae bacterium]|nr:hypothetical protein [Gemmatimonadaceae bacterium]